MILKFSELVYRTAAAALSLLGAANSAAISHVWAIHALVWFPPEVSPPLSVPAAEHACILPLEDQALAQCPPFTPLPALNSVPLVITAPAVQGNFLFLEEVPYGNTRSSVKRQTSPGSFSKHGRKDIEDEKEKELDEGIGLFPLREVPMGGVGMGFIHDLLTSSEVRNFKKEIKGILEDPIGTAEHSYLGRNAVYNENNFF